VHGAPDLFPVFLKLAGRDVLVVGAGAVASSKLAALASSGAVITVVAPEISPAVRASGVRCEERPFMSADLDGKWLVVAAATPEVNRAVATAAEQRAVFVNAVDDPSNASAYLGGVLRRDGVTIAISTDGRAPALAGLLREGVDALLPDDLDTWLLRADELKEMWRATAVPMDERRPQLLEALIALYEKRRPVHTGAKERS
jgi:uroporphyrin-III C-methyltransferase/precorrin-2 dehydrogenase/sirohydrochlorin ferrochelatase